jgi:hypothetical protein
MSSGDAVLKTFGGQEWLTFAVAQYFETEKDFGIPYIRCPEQLRPPLASPELEWVILCTSREYGYIVDLEMREIASNTTKVAYCAALLAIAAAPILIAMFFIGGISFLTVALLAALLIAANVWTWRQHFKVQDLIRTFSDRVSFPEELSAAIKAGISTALRKKLITDLAKGSAGIVAGQLAGHAVGRASGVAAEKLVEKASEKTVEHVVERAMVWYMPRAASSSNRVKQDES